MVQNVIHLKKSFLFLLAGFCLFAQPAISQDTQQDTTAFEIGNPLQATPQTYEVLNIEVTGLTTTRRDFVISQLGFQEGSTITVPGTQISSAIERLYQTGLFSDIQILQTGSTAEGISLEVHVQEQPRLQSYSIDGVSRSDRNDLRDRLSLIPGFAVTTSMKVQATNTIKRYYKEKGFLEYRG